MFVGSRIFAFFVLMISIEAGAASRCGQTLGGDHEAQNTQRDSELAAFEVATIKPTVSGVGGFMTYPGGRMECGMCTLDMLIMMAFDAQHFEIVGTPDCAHFNRYSIVAIPPDSSQTRKLSLTSPTDDLSDEQRQMIQSLLIDRFQLKYHREHRIGPVYELTKGSGKLRLNPPKDATAASRVLFLDEGLMGQNATMTLLAARLGAQLQRPVLDETGLKGFVDFKCEARAESSSWDYNDYVAWILTSVKEIGLKLKAAKGPVQTIVIDDVELPTAN